MYRTLTAVVLALVVFPLTGQAQVSLTYKFPAGEASKTEVRVKSQQTLSLAGMTLPSGSEQTMVVSNVNGERAADGTFRVQHKIESLIASISLPGDMKITFDSANAEAAVADQQIAPLIGILKAQANAQWSVLHGADNRVLAVEGRAKSLASLPEEQRKMVEAPFAPEYLKEKANEELDKVPARPLNMGDTWKQTSVLRLEGGQNLTLGRTFAYRGTVLQQGKTLDQIQVDVQTVSYSVDENAPMPLRVSNSDLKVVKSSGVVLFDRQIGQIVEDTETIQVRGSITFVAPSQEVVGQLDLTLERSSKRQ